MNSSLKTMIPWLTFLLLSACVHTTRTPSTVWIDVRTQNEYALDHIEGDLNLPLASLDPDQLAGMFDRNTRINLYCRSGGRAARAKQIFEDAGFSSVTNAGGIDDARKLRDLQVSGTAN